MLSIRSSSEFFIWQSVNSLPNHKISDLSKLKAFADDNVNATEKFKFDFGMVENIVGKGKNAGNRHFLLFPQTFQMFSFLEVLKVAIVWYWVKPIPHNSIFTALEKKAFENIVGTRKMLVISSFSFSHNILYPCPNKF